MTCYLMASMSSCTESRIHKDPTLDEPLLNRDKNFETDSKFSLSSFASTRLPPLSNFSGKFGALICEVIAVGEGNWYTNWEFGSEIFFRWFYIFYALLRLCLSFTL